ncbi:hypothetical protein GCM10009623_02390 [Nocardioides aestuarii]
MVGRGQGSADRALTHAGATHVKHGGEPPAALAGRVAAYGLAEQEGTLPRRIRVGWGHGPTVPDPRRRRGVSSTGLPLVAGIR